LLITQGSIFGPGRRMRNMNTLFIFAIFLGFLLTGCAQKEKVPNEMNMSDLGIQANLVFLYYQDLEAARRFYDEVIGLEMVLDYGFAKLFRISKTSYIGLVDAQKGMHSSD